MKSENGSSITGQPEIESINDISMNTVSEFMDIEPNVLEPVEPEMESTNEIVADSKPEHNSRKRNASDAHCFAVPQTPKKTCIKEKDEESIGGEMKKCKICIGMINIFEVETDAIVVPTYAEKLSKEELNFASDPPSRKKYNVTRSCPPTWTKFIRLTTPFCLKIIGSTDIFFTQVQVQVLCINSKGMLAGLKSDEKRNFATEKAHIINMQGTYLGNMFYISGARKTTCSTWAQVQTPECAGLNVRALQQIE
ncbi:hypothetical protein GCK72_026295 [Caenorhabditis remanei]|uniref:Uncharacterized protein n=1 Tax=Caenorhabditis remanei TaxID=31234 RepID=A0A6A5G4G7_CAERE|nr:hypothetical protein GCK72_026295 [Caenorhabditis remanei]KAF1749826.1 hypothetical protein GCK72_026295 [Caenorhabditis remanei]